MLTLDPAGLHLAPSAEHPRVYGWLMEMPMGGDVATPVVVADGITSFYFSTSGGIIGAGFHEPPVPGSSSFSHSIVDVGYEQTCGILLVWPTPTRSRFSSETADGWFSLLRSESG